MLQICKCIQCFSRRNQGSKRWGSLFKANSLDFDSIVVFVVVFRNQEVVDDKHVIVVFFRTILPEKVSTRLKSCGPKIEGLNSKMMSLIAVLPIARGCGFGFGGCVWC